LYHVSIYLFTLLYLGFEFYSMYEHRLFLEQYLLEEVALVPDQLSKISLQVDL
jgi:hypothetical protein